MVWRVCCGMFCLLCLMGAALAQQTLEILVPHHRLADDLVPVLQPLVEPGGSLSAMSGKIIVHASPANIAQIREAMAAIDAPVRSLLISVRQGGSQMEDAANAGVRGSVRMGDGRAAADIHVEADGHSRKGSNRQVQTVQTMDGGQAAIFLGTAFPVEATQVVRGPTGPVVVRSRQYAGAGSGFSVQPRLSGEQVTLTISPQTQRMQGRGIITGGGLSTTIRGKLGQWLPLGGVSQSRQIDGAGLTGAGHLRSVEDSAYWIRVDALD